MTWKARCTLTLILGIVLAVPLWRAFLGLVEPGAMATVQDAVERADVAGLLANSVFLALFTAVIALLLGLPLALLLGLGNWRGRRFLAWLCVLPLLIPPHIHTIAWTRVVGDQGWFSNWYAEVFGTALKLRASLGDAGTDAFLGRIYPGPTWIMACSYFPLVTLSVLAGLRSLDAGAVEAGRLFGGRRGALRSVILPLIAPRVLTGAALVFILALSTYPVVSLLDTPTLIQRVFFTLSQAYGNQAAAAVLGLPLVIVAGIVIIGLARIEAKVTPGGTQGSVRLTAEKGGGWMSLAAVVVLLALTLGIPLGSLVAEAGPLDLTGEHVDNYQSVFQRVDRAFVGSFVMTFAGVLALLLASWPMGRALARRGGTAVESVGLGSLALPPELIGVCTLLLWSQAAGGEVTLLFLVVTAALLALPALFRRPRGLGLATWGALAGALVALGLWLHASDTTRTIQSTGITMVVLVYLARFLPVTARMMRNGFQAMDPAEVDAARMVGHGGLSRSFHIELPRMTGAVGASALMAYVLCFTELPATLLTIRPGWQSVQLRIFNMVHYQSIGEVAALCILVVLVAAVPLIIVMVLAPRRWNIL
jgi:iron(III) transport system permease protein